MPNADWFPNRQLEKKDWLDNFVAEAPSIAATLKIDPAAALAGANGWLGHYTTWTTADTAAKAASKTLQDNEKGEIDPIRAFVRLLKSTPGVTPDMLETLHVTAPDTDPSAHVDAQVPVLKLTLLHGHPAVGFTKHGHQGIILYTRYPGDTTWTKLGLDTHSPYVDTRPNRVPGQAETREYCACYADHDQPAGEIGGVFSITVPATMPA